MFIGEIIKEYRNTYNISQREFAAKTDLTYGYINSLEKIYNPSTNKPYSVTTNVAKQIANAMNMPIEELLFKLDENQEFEVNNTPMSKPRTFIVPVYNSLQELDNNIVDFERIAVDINDGNEYFGVEIHEDNFFDYKNLDHVIFKKIPDFKLLSKSSISCQQLYGFSLEDGQDCIVSLEGSEIVFSKVFKQDNGLLLQAIDSSNKTVFYTNKDVKQKHIQILGVAYKLIRNIL